MHSHPQGHQVHHDQHHNNAHHSTAHHSTGHPVAHHQTHTTTTHGHPVAHHQTHTATHGQPVAHHQTHTTTHGHPVAHHQTHAVVHHADHHVPVHGHHATNYSTFPSPIPHSPLKESPLTYYPPFKAHGRVEGHVDVHHKFGSSSSSVGHAHVKSRSGGAVAHSGATNVYSPYYNSQLSYQPVTEQNNSLAPLQGVHLYHNADSVDSMKARMVLEEKGVTWTSEIVNSFTHDQFEPEYMSMNPRGTVPTLTVDNRVTTDARNILNYVNKTFPGPNLVPHNEAEVEVMEHFVDLTERQNPQALSFGKIAGVKKRTFASPYPKRRKVLAAHQRKHAQNRHLVEAYKQKEATIHYQEEIISSPAKMNQVFSNVEHFLHEVEAQLTNGPFAYGGWLASDQFTLADIHVLCFLRYLDVIGLQRIFGTNTNRYYTQGKTRNSYVVAGDEWTSAYGRVTKQYVPIAQKHSKKNKKCLLFTGLGFLFLCLLGLLGFIAMKVCGGDHDADLDIDIDGNSSSRSKLKGGKKGDIDVDIDVDGKKSKGCCGRRKKSGDVDIDIDVDGKHGKSRHGGDIDVDVDIDGKKKSKFSSKHKDGDIDIDIDGKGKSRHGGDLDIDVDGDVHHADLDKKKKYLVLLFPLLLLLPLFLWFCGCIKCKKKNGRNKPKKAVIAKKSRSLSRSSHSSKSSKKAVAVRKSSSSSSGHKKVARSSSSKL